MTLSLSPEDEESLLNKTNIFIQEKYKDLKRSDNSLYIDHLKRVENNFEDNDYEMRIIALLHDIIEDGLTTSEELKDDLGIPRVLRGSIEVLSKHPKKRYQDYIDNVEKDYQAKEIKIYSILDNLSCQLSDEQKSKYLEALKKLIK